MSSPVQTFTLDTLERAGKSVLQGALVAAALLLSSVDAAHVASATWWAQVGTAAGVGGTMGLASVIMSVFSGAKTGTASLSKTVAETAVPSSGSDASVPVVDPLAIAPAAPPVIDPSAAPAA
jgi:hypothetical protein